MTIPYYVEESADRTGSAAPTESTIAATPPAEPVARRHFLSWVRDGVAGQLSAESQVDPGTGSLPARARLDTGLTVNGIAVTGPSLELHGPGDVIGVDRRQIIRAEPPDRTTDFEAGHLAAVDFDDPALPWRYTPAAPHPACGLRPWLVLVVLDLARAEVRLDPPAGGPLPVLTAPRDELPDLTHSPAWAHAEITAVPGEDLAVLLRERPERTLSRLLSPRVLAEGHRYLACLVPAFAHGVAAGLGAEPAGARTDPAWSGTTGTVTLPVYYSWTFTTAVGGDFPALAARLHPVVPQPGRRTLSYRDADPDLTGSLGSDPGIATVLPVLHPAAATPDAPASTAWGAAMRQRLAAGATEFVPPIYLAAHTGHGPAWTGAEPPWQVELNSDPRLRAVAGLGAGFVRENQEALISAAWQQAAELDAVNRDLARAQLGRSIGESLYRRHFPAPGSGLPGLTDFTDFTDLAGATGPDAGRLLSRSAQALPRVVDRSAAASVASVLEDHPATAGLVAPGTQKALRPTGPVARAAGASASEPLVLPLSEVAAGTLDPAPPHPPGADLVRLTWSGYRTPRFAELTADYLRRAFTPWWRGWQDLGTRPVTTPGLPGVDADLVTVDPATGAPGALRIGLRRGFRTQDRLDVPDGFLTVPGISGAPAGLTPLTARLVRRFANGPALLVLYAEHGNEAVARQHYVRIISGLTPAGYASAGPLLPAGGPVLSDYAPCVTARPPSGLQPGTQPGQEILISWLDRKQGRLETLVMQVGAKDVPATWSARTGVDLPVLKGTDPSTVVSLAVDWLPPYAPDHSKTPTAMVVSWLLAAGSKAAPAWTLNQCVVTDFATTAQRVVDPGSRGVVATRDPARQGATHRPWLAIAATTADDGTYYHGRAELVAFVTVPAALNPDGSVASWTTNGFYGRDAAQAYAVDPLPGTVAATGTTRTLLGDLDEHRLDLLAARGDRFLNAAIALQTRFRRPQTEPRQPAGPAPYALDALAGGLRTALDPAVTVPPMVLAQVRLADAPLPGAPARAAASGVLDPLRPRRFEPRFPQPMVDPLREQLAELTFPAAEAVPVDGVALMAGNPELIAAYLAGVNHEFGRELLWRGYPSTGRATWFNRFFDARSGTGGPDILDLDKWGNRRLAEVVTGVGAANTTLLLVRGSLVRRFPNLMVQAVRGQWTGSPPRRVLGTETLPPLFANPLGPDLMQFGFPLAPAALRGTTTDAGWFLVLAEAPTQSRFAGTDGTGWVRPGAPTAASLLALPYRVAIHASDLLTTT